MQLMCSACACRAAQRPAAIAHGAGGRDGGRRGCPHRAALDQGGAGPRACAAGDGECGHVAMPKPWCRALSCVPGNLTAGIRPGQPGVVGPGAAAIIACMVVERSGHATELRAAHAARKELQITMTNAALLRAGAAQGGGAGGAERGAAAAPGRDNLLLPRGPAARRDPARGCGSASPSCTQQQA